MRCEHFLLFRSVIERVSVVLSCVVSIFTVLELLESALGLGNEYEFLQPLHVFQI